VVGQPAILSALTSAKNSITILAPTNAAFAAFLNVSANTAAIKADAGLVPALLEYHVLKGVYKSTAFGPKGAFAPTLLTNSSYTNVTGGQVVEAIVEAGKVDIYSGLHAKSTVVVAVSHTPNYFHDDIDADRYQDVAFDGGVIHVIDTVLTIPESPSATAEAAGLTSLASALTSAGLVSTVDGLHDVTIFAPTNAAFAAIADTTAKLTKKQLTEVLTYHVISEAVAYSTTLKDGEKVATVEGDKVTISLKGGKVLVDDATVVTADVLVSNGVVHVIDK
jgi:transforming growth factor-beta-induced protein